MYSYIKGKTHIEIPPRMEGESDVDYSERTCGERFWKGITLAPKKIPECSLCREDYAAVKAVVKEHAKDKDEDAEYQKYEIKCTKFCIWFDYFEEKRRSLISDGDEKFWHFRRETVH
jgi:hypothetical protein